MRESIQSILVPQPAACSLQSLISPQYRFLESSTIIIIMVLLLVI